MAATGEFAVVLQGKESIVDDDVDVLSALLVEGDQVGALTFSQSLARYGIVIDIAASLSRARRLLRLSGDRMDVVVLDPQLPDGRGEDLLPEIEGLAKQPGVIILSDYPDDVRPDAMSYRAIWVAKMVKPPALAAIMRRVASGHAQNILHRFAKRFRLTRKETVVLDGVARGVGPKQLALDLRCSTQAVYALLAKVSAKTNCASYPCVMAKLFQFSCHGLGHNRWNSTL